MVPLYSAIALQPTFWALDRREDVRRNLDHINDCLELAVFFTSLELPVKLIALPECVVMGLPSKGYSTEIPGPETDALGKKAQEIGCYLMAQLTARNAKVDRVFNTAIIIAPNGDIILRYHKINLFPREALASPHDIWDRWVEEYGDDLDAFFPVVDTSIGRLAAMVSVDRYYPEMSRGFAMNGAEVLCIPTAHEPFPSRGTYELQTRSRALDNNCYVVSPNSGDYYPRQESRAAVSIFGGHSMVVDFRGNVLADASAPGSTFAAAQIDIEAQRRFRAQTTFGNWLKDLRTEVYRKIYERPIMPVNAALDSPLSHDLKVRAEAVRASIERLLEAGIWQRPGS
ncbi:MAG: hydrolase [Candidatus Tectomicrobia bacterium]|nr:hydrolase [Candidatus Tectomicrobia bacterium]